MNSSLRKCFFEMSANVTQKRKNLLGLGFFLLCATEYHISELNKLSHF